MIRNTKVIRPLVILGISVLVFLGLKITRPVHRPVDTRERIWTVDTVIARPAPLSPALTLYGQLETSDLTRAAASNRGRVQQVLVREGQRITPGQLMLTLDERDFQPARLQAQAKVQEFLAEIDREQLRFESDKKALKHELSLLKLAEAAVARAVTMKAKNLGSNASLDEAREALENQKLAANSRQYSLNEYAIRLSILKAKLQQQQAELQIAELDLERSRIHAPFEGYVADVEVAEGDHVNVNQILLSYYPADSLELRALIPAPFQAEIQLALLERTVLTASASGVSGPINLRLDRLAGQAESRGIDGFFTIQPKVEDLRLGSRLSLILDRPIVDNAVAIPYEALYGRNRVYKIVDGRLLAINVRVLGDYSKPDEQTALLISSSLIKEGDLILTTHLPNALNGLRVRFENRVEHAAPEDQTKYPHDT